MADILLNNCRKCGGSPMGATRNGRRIIQCSKCGFSVDICAAEECELSRRHGRHISEIIVPFGAALAAAEKWNAKEEANG